MDKNDLTAGRVQIIAWEILQNSQLQICVCVWLTLNFPFKEYIKHILEEQLIERSHEF
mgnify:CR=1 FL=1